MAPLFAHYFLSELERNSSADVHKSKLKLESVDDFTSQYKILDLKKRINDMIRIKGSVSQELRDLEAKRLDMVMEINSYVAKIDQIKQDILHYQDKLDKLKISINQVLCGSVSQELRDLEAKRLDMVMEINSYVSKIDQIKQDILHYQDKLDKLKISINQAQLAHTESLRQNSPQLYPPLMIKASSLPRPVTPSSGQCRTMSECFDFSRCSLTSGFPMFVYDPEKYYPAWKISLFLKSTIYQALKFNPHFTSNPKEACVFVVLIGESDVLFSNVQDLYKLPYWGNNVGTELFRIRPKVDLVLPPGEYLAPSHHTGYAIIAQTIWTHSSFRPKVDLVLPPGVGLPGGDIWNECPYLLPARRKYLLSYQGSGRRIHTQTPGVEEERITKPNDGDRDNSPSIEARRKYLLSYQGSGRRIHTQTPGVEEERITKPNDGDRDNSPSIEARRKYLLSYQGSGRRIHTQTPGVEEERITKPNDGDRENNGASIEASSLTKYLTTSTSDLFHFDWSCVSSSDVCYSESVRSEVLHQSTFVLIYADDLSRWKLDNEDMNNGTDKRSDKTRNRHSDEETVEDDRAERYASTIGIQMRLYEALKYGAVPVIVGGDNVMLPFEEVLDWNKILIPLPVARIPELHLLLRSISDEDIVAFRHQGRQVFTRYLATLQSQMDTLVAVVRDRLGIPPAPVMNTKAVSVFRQDFTPLKMDPVIAEAEPEENLGPLEPPYPSPSFWRNNTLFLSQGYEMWNTHLSPFYLYPQLPFDPILPSDAKFMGSDYGFRPINKGAGGSGKEFYENLGSNKQREQFTIIILTYERDQVLINSLSRLNNLPYLNKVVVVWNSVQPPREDLRWPDIGVPVVVVRTNTNDLNNRFKPYDVIETEAVLNMDDDVYLRHDEIMFAFRVWREQRDRIVGFPGRYHAWDQNNQGGWLYNSNYSCELSMASLFYVFYLKRRLLMRVLFPW
ncbi:exostosin-3 [Diaphorina citri]|uniref:Exostosin-3 n=1 Tax=Diaphorina citri TaxID=121845 RepID=A0A3Q0J7T2_DIACI|nr:exostosin-3 [Diaphorina citri]